MIRNHSILPAVMLVFYCFISISVNAQLSEKFKDHIIQTVLTELENRYVFPDKIPALAERLQALQKEGYFDELSQLDSFAHALTAIIYEVAEDKHIIVSRKQNSESSSEENDAFTNWINQRMKERMFYRRYNANFKSVSKMEGNIGYLDMRGFYGLDYGRAFADGAMEMLATSDAIIIDLRNNSGGRGDMVDYLLSYFFEEPIITGRSRKRNGDNFVNRTHKTAQNTATGKITETPLFILTSSKTFSAAEAFSYPLQAYQRATFIGETSKGGGNAGDLISISDELEIFIPDVAALPHPVTKTTFEGIGIIPDIEVESEKALEVALEEAKKAAVIFKAKNDEKAKTKLLELNEIISNFDGQDNQIIVDAYLKCKANDLIFEEWELNALGYQLFAKEESKRIAEAVFEANTVLYPHSANVFDSYAEALLANNKVTEAISNYQRAIALAEQSDHQNLDLFKENLAQAQKLLEKN